MFFHEKHLRVCEELLYYSEPSQSQFYSKSSTTKSFSGEHLQLLGGEGALMLGPEKTRGHNETSPSSQDHFWGSWEVFLLKVVSVVVATFSSFSWWTITARPGPLESSVSCRSASNSSSLSSISSDVSILGLYVILGAIFFFLGKPNIWIA